MFELVCSGCGKVHEISTGADICFEHSEPWSYEQVVCTSCHHLSSQAAGCHFKPEPCQGCGGAVEAWSGRVFFERTGDEAWQQSERVRGPCPACGTALRETDTRMLGLWD